MSNKVAFFRFYEELNDFLPFKDRKKNLTIPYKGSPAVKDVFESLGVPHTEVELILVNGTPVDFSYRIQPEDYISIFPIFETLDITSVSPLKNKPLSDLAFVLDAHLGKLARYLRMLGFDSIYHNKIKDTEIIDASLRKKRIILTRDIGILKNNKVMYGYYIRSQHSKTQLKEVVNRFRLLNLIMPFTRCLVCNGQLQEVSRQEVIDKLEPQTKRDFDEFYQCTNCRKIYWKGSHYTRMNQMISELQSGSDL